MLCMTHNSASSAEQQQQYLFKLLSEYISLLMFLAHSLELLSLMFTEQVNILCEAAAF